MAEKYYFKTNGKKKDTCIERCLIKNNGTMIGSLACQKCTNCIDFDETPFKKGGCEWVVCSKIKLATLGK